MHEAHVRDCGAAVIPRPNCLVRMELIVVRSIRMVGRSSVFRCNDKRERRTRQTDRISRVREMLLQADK